MTSKKEIINSFYLFSKPSFFEGFGRLFDWSSSLSVYWYSETDDDSDYAAAKYDWRAVGNDFQLAIDSYGKQSISK